MELETGRLRLRDFQDNDIKNIQEYATDPLVIKYLTFGPNTEEDSKQFIEFCKKNQTESPRTNYELGITHPMENKLIGGCGIKIDSQKNSVAVIGYCLNRYYWGNGYATEAAFGLLRFGFEELRMHRIYAYVDPENLASRRVLEKIGMTCEGHLRENMVIHGEHRDSLIYAILKQEWPKKP